MSRKSATAPTVCWLPSSIGAIDRRSIMGELPGGGVCPGEITVMPSSLTISSRVMGVREEMTLWKSLSRLWGSASRSV